MDLANLISPSAIAALLEILAIDIVLAGDNAIVVGALAAGLPAEQRRKAVQSSRVRTMDEHFAELFSSYSALAPRRVPITAIDAAMAPAAASALY